MGRGEWGKAKTFPHLHFQILWFPSPGRWQKGVVGTAEGEHGDGKPQVIKGLVLVGLSGGARAFHGTVLGNGAHRAFLWAA